MKKQMTIDDNATIYYLNGDRRFSSYTKYNIGDTVSLKKD